MIENLKLYEDDLKTIEDISPKERKELFIKCKNKDHEARNKLIESYLNSLRKIVLRYKDLDISLEDLIQDASIYLIDLIDNIDLTNTKKLSKLITYLNTAVSSLVERTQYNPLLGTGENKVLNKINEYIEQYESIYGCSPDKYYIAAELGLSVETVLYVLNSDKRLCYLDEDQERKESITDEVSTEDIVCSKLGYKKLKEDILNDKKLTIIEKKYIKSLFGFFDDIPKNYKEVGKLYNINEASVGQVTRCGMKKIRNYASYIKDYR